MTLLETLRPTSKRLVIDVVREAGHDVQDWANYSRGPRFASTNPKYCYEWCFSQPGHPTILNLWHAQMMEKSGTVSLETNIRSSVKRYTGGGSHSVWRKRAQLLDDAVRDAARSHAPVRVIINDGRMRIPNDPQAKASSVALRMLDPLPWQVASYDEATGAAVLVRGPSADGTVDQFKVANVDAAPALRRPVAAGTALVRDPAVAAHAQKRASGLCEFCGAPGFTRVDGTVYLETHHIVPLEDGGADSKNNVAAICPTHHREAHFGARAAFIRETLLTRVGSRSPRRSV